MVLHLIEVLNKSDQRPTSCSFGRRIFESSGIDRQIGNYTIQKD